MAGLTARAKVLIDRASTVTRLHIEREGFEAARKRNRSGGTVLAWALPHLLTYVASAGCDAGRLRTVPGLRGRDLDDPDTRVTEAAAVEAWRLAAAMTADEALGLHVAETAPAGTVEQTLCHGSSPTEFATPSISRVGCRS